MSLFLSTTTNKLDKKGRVSVPSGFRTALAGQDFHGVVLFCSYSHQCLEGVGWDVMEDLSSRIDHYDFLSSEQDDLATAIFGEAVQLPFDGEGRIIIPQALIEYAGLEGQISFVGMGKKFQIWSPEVFERRRLAARERVKSQGLTVPKAKRGDA